MAKNAFLDWDQTASNNTDVGGIGILGTNAVSNFDDALRTVMAQLRAGVDGEVVYAAKSANYTALLNDNNAWHRYTATATVSLTAAATLGANWHYYVQADGAVVTIDPNGAETINGAATLVLQSGQTASIICTGSAFIAVVEGTVITGPGQQGYLYGLTLSNNASDATNDIDIATGVAAADTSPYSLMQLTSGITKRLDAAWAVGTGNGGLDTGAIANTTYHMWLIQRSDTGVVDVLFSASATAPTMPTNYDRKRRIGAIVRVSAAIRPFIQHEDTFWWNEPTNGGYQDISVTNPGTTTQTRTLTTPTGRQFDVIINLGVNNSSGASSVSIASSLELPNIVSATVGVWNTTFGTNPSTVIQGIVRTNTSAQIRTNTNVSNASIILQISSLGWIDNRGRF
jgi:hypothetical protein